MSGLRTRVLARLLGVRVVERDEQHAVIRIPRWLHGQRPEITRRLIADAELVGKRVLIRHGDMLTRVDVLDATKFQTGGIVQPIHLRLDGEARARVIRRARGD